MEYGPFAVMAMAAIQPREVFLWLLAALFACKHLHLRHSEMRQRQNLSTIQDTCPNLAENYSKFVPLACSSWAIGRPGNV